MLRPAQSLELGQGYAVRKAIEAPAKLALTGGMFAVNPALTAAQAGAVVGGRAIDAITASEVMLPTTSDKTRQCWYS